MRRQTQIADFIEKQSASVGRFEPAATGILRAGESAAFMPEQFAFNQIFGKGSTVDRYERSIAAMAQSMDMPCDQFLTRSGFADDQGGRFAGRDALDVVEQVA